MSKLLIDREIKKRANWEDMINPFVYYQCAESCDFQGGIISYGLSSCGYDARLSSEFVEYKKNFSDRDTGSDLLDPHKVIDTDVDQFKAKNLLLRPGGFVLGSTIEYFRIPEDIFCICVGKSTYARCGIITNVTPLEPGWEGHITLEISNTNTVPVKLYAFEGIIQVLFFQLTEYSITTYKSRNGKYQNQQGIVLPKV